MARLGPTLSIYDIEINYVGVADENCQEKVTLVVQDRFLGCGSTSTFTLTHEFNPTKDSIIKLVVIAFGLKMMFNMRFFILITLLKMIV